MRGDAGRRLTPATDLTAYRVIQEALTNVSKHSAGRRARLTLGYERDELCIIVDDLGGAESSGTAVSSGQHGITGMRERVHALGGRFRAQPRPGGGFRVTAALPYQPHSPPSQHSPPSPAQPYQPAQRALP